MPSLVAVFACVALVAIAELVRFGAARVLGVPTTRVARLFLDARSGPRWARAAAILAGTVATYLGVVALAFGFYTCAGVPSTDVECTVDAVVEGYPAYGKLERGDRIIALDGEPVRISPSVMIDRRNGAPVRLTVERRGTTRDVTIQPVGHDGHWVVGFRPRLEPARHYGGGDAVRSAFAFPFRRARDLTPAPPVEQGQPGGPVRITEVYQTHHTQPPGPGELALAEAMRFAVYLLLLVLAIDLARVVRAVLRR